MPIHAGVPFRMVRLVRPARREVLRAGAAALGMVVCRSASAAADPNRLALLSDTHIPGSPETESRGVNMTANLRQAVKEVTQLEPRPAAVLVNGDCAFLKGEPADYRNLAACVAPLAERDLPLHLTMGNHDDRGPFYAALAAQKPARPLVESKHVGLLETPHANWFLLDSLREVDVVTGEFGRTPRLENQIGTQTKVRQPGRDHWPGAQSILVSGGGTRAGIVVGSTDAIGGHPKDRPLTPNDLWATVMRHLDIPYKDVNFLDHSGRPMPMLPDGEPIRELI